MLENGGKVEKQVLEEGEIFDPYFFLEGLTRLWKQKPACLRDPEPTCASSEILHPNDTLEKRETKTEYFHWEYYKCPVQNCFVSCGMDNVEYYLESAIHQLHNFYQQ